MKYRKKPVEVEAVKYFGVDNYEETPEWLEKAISDGIVFVSDKYDRESKTVIEVTNIKTLEGDMMVSEGDYIIRGTEDELYPCKPDIFEGIYDKVQ